MLIYELARLPLQSSSALQDPSTPQGSAFQTVLQTLSEQPGWLSNTWGIQRDTAEGEDVAWMIIGWTSLSAHETFIASPAYVPFFSAAGVFLSGAPTMRHVPLTLNSSSLTGEVGIAFWGFESSIDKEDVEKQVMKLGFEKESFGWVVEEVEVGSVKEGLGLAVVGGMEGIKEGVVRWGRGDCEVLGVDVVA